MVCVHQTAQVLPSSVFIRMQGVALKVQGRQAVPSCSNSLSRQTQQETGRLGVDGHQAPSPPVGETWNLEEGGNALCPCLGVRAVGCSLGWAGWKEWLVWSWQRPTIPSSFQVTQISSVREESGWEPRCASSLLLPLWPLAPIAASGHRHTDFHNSFKKNKEKEMVGRSVRRSCNPPGV